MKYIFLIFLCCLPIHASLLNGLVAHYTFDGTLSDSSIYGNNGTASGSITYQTGILGSGAVFNGSSYISVANSSSITIDGQITISAWVKTYSSSFDGACILQKGQSGVVWDYGLGLYYSDPSYRSSISDWITNDTSYQNKYYNDFYLLTVVVNETTDNIPHLYINGQEMDGTIIRHNLSTSLDTDWIRQSTYGIQIGLGHPGAYFQGVVDDLRLYNRALSTSEILQLAGVVPELQSFIFFSIFIFLFYFKKIKENL